MQVVIPEVNQSLKADIEAEAIAKAEEGVIIKEKNERDMFWAVFKEISLKECLKSILKKKQLQ